MLFAERETRAEDVFMAVPSRPNASRLNTSFPFGSAVFAGTACDRVRRQIAFDWLRHRWARRALF